MHTAQSPVWAPRSTPTGHVWKTSWYTPQVALPDRLLLHLPSTMMKDRSGHARLLAHSVSPELWLLKTEAGVRATLDNVGGLRKLLGGAGTYA